MNPEVSNFIDSAPQEQKAIMETLRKLIHDAVPNTTEDFKWGRPVFRTSHDFAYFKPFKTYLTLGFFNFHDLKDNHLLEGTGKDMRHIKFKNAGDINPELLTEWFQTASN